MIDLNEAIIFELIGKEQTSQAQSMKLLETDLPTFHKK